ncbi:MAG TPA: hypothetical protein VLC46_21295 [Thermoanaerobaculia bacterium]|jgi:hypothetical protein|nr:hypothetical protein [Thermoanaerobaculia bacterium]
MNKILVGLLLGAGLGAVDGMTAWFTPAVRAGIIGIVIGSTFKGMIAGIAAGWFARRVQSVAWGIAFGLLIGALLAYGVAAMQHGYYFEIMLPGSIVGAIVGWATQRYGRPARGGTAAATIVAIFLVTITVSARAAEPVKAADAFAHLKSLAGTWSGHAMTPDGPPANVSYRLTAGGTAVMETLFGGTPHEMLTVYTMNGDDIVATHFCGADNQPVMKLDAAQSTPDRLVFVFVSVDGEHSKDHPHVHNGYLHFIGSEQLEAMWSMQNADGSAGELNPKFFLTRAK